MKKYIKFLKKNRWYCIKSNGEGEILEITDLSNGKPVILQDGFETGEVND